MVNDSPEHSTNVTLVGCLNRLGWSPEQFAYRLNEMARSLLLPMPAIHPKSPRRWLTARPPATRPCVPRQPWPGLVCSLLSRHLQEPVTLASLGWDVNTGALFVPADDGLNHPWDPGGAVASLREVLEAIGMDRRHFVALSGTGLTAVAHDWLLDPPRLLAAVRGQRVDLAVAEDLEHIAEARRHLDDVLGGGDVLRAVRDDLWLVTRLLDNGRYTEQVGQRLYAVAAEFARIAGLRAYDAGDHALAQRYFVVGLRAAHTSGDRALGANILNCTATRAQGRMFEFNAAVDPAAEPGYIYWWSNAEAHLTAGSSALAMNRPRDADTHYRDALSSIAPAFPRDRALILTGLAKARLKLRELDGACRAATQIKDFDAKFGDLLSSTSV